MPDTQGKTIILGITGGVAAYKAAELARLWVKAGYGVQAVMTDAAMHFVGPATLQALSGRPVLTSLWGTAGNGMDHIHASRHADLIVVDPASADFIAKLAQGRADDLLSALCLARTCPLAIAPAMNHEMWSKAATQRNLEQLRVDGIKIIGPDAGEQACGETGLGRMSEPAAILDAVDILLGPKPLAGRTVLITAGPTFEPVDPVRGMSNLSSGKMGYALAQAAREAGARVLLISGPVCLDAPSGVERINVTTAKDMLDAVFSHVRDASIFISVAAVADFRPAKPAARKIKKDSASLTLELVPNVDILASVTSLPSPPFCIGFAAESENLAVNAEIKRKNKKLPMLVANLIQNSIGQDAAELLILDEQGSHPLPVADKLVQARLLLRHAQSLIG
ncbi:MAG: bifunctional phosphopantothenoylcysteine decarboxylase/phosphopantothenate--cysteine ligase CoaBC [Hydrogenophilaceae bacterium]|nr:bifunctional phosphopantothenoylcysteine decarboxylase/phosphopantothenate--cysteine ligase CoaBC [Hydrogenophilaceae bacterium]